MNKRITKLKVSLFRGLYRYSVDLDRNLLIFAKNGGGKSSIVQAIEWLFSSQVENIDVSELRHIMASGDEKSFVEIFLSDLNTVRKNISADSMIESSGAAIDYIEGHPSVESFILRRAKLLDFIHATPSERYKKIMSLIGLEWLNGVQASLQEASDCAGKSLRDLRIEYDSIFKKYHDRYSDVNSVDSLFVVCSSLLKEIGVNGVDAVSSMPSAMEELSKKRSPENYALLGKVERCLDLLSTFDPDGLVKSISTLNVLRQRVRELSSDVVEKDILKVLTEVNAYFQETESVYACPVCERPFDDSYLYLNVKKNVEDRLVLMEEMSGLMKNNDSQTRSLESLVIKVGELCKSYLRDIVVILKSQKEVFEDVQLEGGRVFVAGLYDEYGKASLNECIIDPHYVEGMRSQGSQIVNPG